MSHLALFEINLRRSEKRVHAVLIHVAIKRSGASCCVRAKVDPARAAVSPRTAGDGRRARPGRRTAHKSSTLINDTQLCVFSVLLNCLRLAFTTVENMSSSVEMCVEELLIDSTQAQHHATTSATSSFFAWCLFSAPVLPPTSYPQPRETKGLGARTNPHARTADCDRRL